MKRVLLAVDGTKGSERATETLIGMFSEDNPGPVVTIVNVKEIPSEVLIGESMSLVPGMDAILKAQHGAEYQEAMNARSEKIMTYHKDKLENAGISSIKCIAKDGHPAEGIITCAKEVDAELIIIGSRGKRPHDFLIGSVSREVANSASIPVLMSR